MRGEGLDLMTWCDNVREKGREEIATGQGQGGPRLFYTKSDWLIYGPMVPWSRSFTMVSERTLVDQY